MKRGVLSLLFGLAVCATALGQGRIRFNNDSLHLVYLNPDPTYLVAADAGLAGQAIPANDQLPSNLQLVVDLYAGLSSANLSLIATTTFAGSTPGIWSPANVTLPAGLPAGTPLFFQVLVHEISFFEYVGSSVIFTGTAGTTAYNSITSFWPVGDFPMDTYGPGSRGAIMVGLIPEPGVIALAALALGAFLARRRK